ncbi:hypothetical protein DYH09_32610, partial [bacterium CPR1]|nr:hypothetical protein [bacterium CPR1]
LDLAQQISVNAIIAFGMTLTILIGGIDLSVGALVALVGTITVAALARGEPETQSLARLLLGLGAAGESLEGTSHRARVGRRQSMHQIGHEDPRGGVLLIQAVPRARLATLADEVEEQAALAGPSLRVHDHKPGRPGPTQPLEQAGTGHQMGADEGGTELGSQDHRGCQAGFSLIGKGPRVRAAGANL